MLLRFNLREAGLGAALGLLLCVPWFGAPCFAQTAGLGIFPSRLEMEVQPGTQKTASFEIEAPPSETPVRGRLVISLTDWDIRKDGSITFTPASDKPTSAIPWITFTPAAVSIVSGRREIVRVTVTLPAGTPPGEYRAGFFIQERPPATPPPAGQRVVVFRFRHFVSLFVMVPPLGRKASFSNVSLGWVGNSLRLLCSMKNDGAIHLRPTITWSLRGEGAQEIAGTRRFESTVLLPFTDLDEGFNLDPLTPGRYQVVASVDFHEGGPVQSITKSIEITAPPSQPAAPPGVK